MHKTRPMSNDCHTTNNTPVQEYVRVWARPCVESDRQPTPGILNHHTMDDLGLHTHTNMCPENTFTGMQLRIGTSTLKQQRVIPKADTIIQWAQLVSRSYILLYVTRFIVQELPGGNTTPSTEYCHLPSERDPRHLPGTLIWARQN